MIWVEKLSERIARFVVKQHNSHVKDGDHKIEGIAQEIDILRELKEELVRKEKEIERQRLEWDRTFDSIIDNIVIIDKNRCISKINRSFLACVREHRGPWDSLVGMPWDEFKEDVGLPTEIDSVGECFSTGLPSEATIDLRHGVFSVVANPIIDEETEEVIGVVRISRDITKIEYQKKKLERRASIYNAISEMSKTLVNHDDWNEAVKLILDELGVAIGASRVYIFRNIHREDRICSVLQHCFHNEKYRDCTANSITECINYNTMIDWKESMERGEGVQGNLVDCQICPMKQRCSCVDEVLVSAVPIFVDRKWWGFIGFDYMNGTRKWKDHDETLLRIAADILGGVIYHRGRYWNTLSELEGCEDKLNGTESINTEE
jgi:hypothetical protein